MLRRFKDYSAKFFTRIDQRFAVKNSSSPSCDSTPPFSSINSHGMIMIMIMIHDITSCTRFNVHFLQKYFSQSQTRFNGKWDSLVHYYVARFYENHSLQKEKCSLLSEHTVSISLTHFVVRSCYWFLNRSMYKGKVINNIAIALVDLEDHSSVLDRTIITLIERQKLVIMTEDDI